ncbi:DNA adenine methylase [Barnesiella intestinihominis]|jgi:adenine-specific DNA-methyltransferase|uniref:DNA adenine methylase n=1 Tax=Barnesiella intestinihominis TaxID=487174 RepID=UPI003AAD4548
MESIGQYLKGVREGLNLPLQEVCKRTNIDTTLLSRIENGRRLPTKDQVIHLVRLYGCDEHKSLVLLGSERILFTLDGDNEYKLEVIQVAAEKIRFGKIPSLFPKVSNDNTKRFELESRRYIGNKAKLTQWIMNIIREHTGGFHSFFDVFAGTASVSKAVIPYADNIIMNDFLYSNNIIYKAFFGEGKYEDAKLSSLITQYNTINPDDIPDNYFSDNFGNKFFDYKNAKLIGWIREDIERHRKALTEKEYAILLASLIYSIDKIANTVGHFDAYIKKPIAYHPLTLQLIKPLSPNSVEIYREDSNLLAERVSADVAYIDPPYNSRQYSRFYHIYENLITWEKPELYGVAMKPKPQNMSAYCTTSAVEAFKNLVMKLQVKYIAVSYNNTYDSKSGSSKNKITLEEIRSILEQRGKTTIYDCAHKCFNTGKTEFIDHKELLFITEVQQ